jgi:predicted GNAT family acetyltransferase
MIKIVFHEERAQAVALDGEQAIGECTFRESGDVWTVDHTGVRESYGGQGIARKLVDEVFHQAQKSGKKIRPLCSYAAKVLMENQEYSDLRL